MKMRDGDCDDASAWSVQELKAPAGWMFQISCGLSFLHFWGIIHCDLKPKNVLVYGGGKGGVPGVGVTLKICDLGLAIRAAKYGDIVGPSVAKLPALGSGGKLVSMDNYDYGTITATCHGGK